MKPTRSGTLSIVFDVALIALLYPEATDSKGVKVPELILEEDLQRHARRCSRGSGNEYGRLVGRLYSPICRWRRSSNGRGSRGRSDSDGQQGRGG